MCGNMSKHPDRTNDKCLLEFNCLFACFEMYKSINIFSNTFINCFKQPLHLDIALSSDLSTHHLDRYNPFWTGGNITGWEKIRSKK